MSTWLVSQRGVAQRWLRQVAIGVFVAAVPVSTAIGQADSISIWTTALQSGTPAAKAAAVDGLERTSAASLPTATAQALVAELNRVHAALLRGGDPGTLDAPDDHSGYYLQLVGIVTELRTTDAALALVPAVEVSSAVEHRVARYGGDSAVTLLANLVGQRHSPDDALETLGLVWFWSDSTGSALSDASRGRIITTLTSATATGDDEDMLGVSAALRYAQDPAFLALAQTLRTVAAAQGTLGAFTVQRLDGSVLPALTAAAAARPTSALVTAIPQLITAVCSTTSSSERNGTCQSAGNDVANAGAHFAGGQFDQARQEYGSAAEKLARARDAGVFTAAEYAVMSGDIMALLARSW